MYFLIVLLILPFCGGSDDRLALTEETVVMQTSFGDLELAFFPNLAPVTVAHIMRLFKLGAYQTAHIFRVDAGFVAQISDVSDRLVPSNPEQAAEASKTVIGEFSDVRHERGILSMGRFDDPNSGKSSFSILLGNAPHLDGKYTVFGRLVDGFDALAKIEAVPVRKEGMWVFPLERITIQATYIRGNIENNNNNNNSSDNNNSHFDLDSNSLSPKTRQAILRRSSSSSSSSLSPLDSKFHLVSSALCGAMFGVALGLWGGSKGKKAMHFSVIILISSLVWLMALVLLW